MSRGPARQQAEEGFVLVATLWFVALLAFAAVIIEGWISSSLDRANLLAERVGAQSALVSAEERVAFAMVGGGTSPRGLELAPRAAAANPEDAPPPPGEAGLPTGPFIALDDRPYRIGDVVVRLQDAAGLYDLASANHDTLRKLLRRYGVTGGDTDKLADALLAYTGRPTDERGESAGDADYRRAGLPPARHARLLTPWEPLRILGWDRAAGLWQRAAPFPEIATLGPIGSLNVNTAPAGLLAVLGDMDERAAARLVAARTARPYTEVSDLEPDIAPAANEDRPRSVLPSNIVRLKLMEPGEPLMRVIELRLTPAGRAPIRVDYVVDLPPDQGAKTVSDAPPLPELRVAPRNR